MRRATWVHRVILTSVMLVLAACGSTGGTHSATTTASATTTQSRPTATPLPTSGTWQSAATLSPTGIDLEFAPFAPQTGYYCADRFIPTNSSQWLNRSDDGGMTWRPLGGLALPKVFEPGPFGCKVFVNANDPNDVFVEIRIPTGCSGQGPCQGANANSLWRSRDGGASWSELNLPQPAGELTGALNHLIVADARLIGLEEDYLQSPPECSTDSHADAALHVNDLVASDDNGHTWHAIGQSIFNQGLSISKVSGRSGGQLLQNNGSAIVVVAGCETSGSTGASTRNGDWISNDDGATWTQVSVNGGSDVESFMYTASPSSATYGVAVDDGSGYTALPIVRYSADGGASWRSLPSLSAIPGAQTAGAQVNVYWVLAMPDGSVLASTYVGTTGANGHTLSSAVYVIAPQSANPTWQQFTTNKTLSVGSSMPFSKTAQGWILWGFSYDQTTNSDTYRYLTPLP